MELLPEEFQNYAEAHTSQESEILKALDRETYAKIIMPRMLSGHLQGRILAMFSQMIKPRVVLEIGTYTGYSAICFSEGLQPGGVIHTIDINEELEEMVSRYFEQAGISDRVHQHIGNALEIIPTIEEGFDLVFIDADKNNYPNYFDLVIDKVNPGGYILADNVLWSGKVLGLEDKLDEDTRALIDFNDKIHKDPRVENVLFPVRDGIMVMRKI